MEREQSQRQQPVLDWLIPRLFSGSVRQVVEKLCLQAEGAAKNVPLFVVFTPNPEQVELAERDPHFATWLGAADLLLPDGNGLIWAASRSGRPLQRVTGREVLETWLDLPPSQRPRTLLLGGRPDAAAQLAEQLDSTGNQLSGLEGFSNILAPTAQEQSQFWKRLETFQPRVIFVGFGAPKQERWIIENREKLAQAGVRAAVAVGGAFDVLSGQLSSPPSWVVQSKLEWLYRLWQEPSRWQRQTWLVRFVWRVITGR